MANENAPLVMPGTDLRNIGIGAMAWRFLWLRRVVAAMLLLVAASGCAPARRTAYLVVDHHVGMVGGVWDIVNGEAEEREARMAKLRSDLEASRAGLAVEQDQGRTTALLRQHVALQDAMLAAMMESHGHHGCGGHREVDRGGNGKSEEGNEEQSEAHVH